MAHSKTSASIWRQHRFAAFISYSRADKAVGETFQRDIEHYKIPKPVIGRETLNGPVPKRLVPIFRDITDLGASGDLGAQINKALSNSAFLIVLCSPASAGSKWVNAEIEFFKKKGGKDRIIAVILDGEPVEHHPETAPNGAFPPALMRVLGPDGELTDEREAEPLAPDMRPRAEGPDYAVLKTVAAMIGLEPDILSQRRAEMERRERRFLRRVAMAISVLAITATVAALVAWTQLISARENQSRAFASLAWNEIAAGQNDRAARFALQSIPAGEGIALRTDARDGEDAMQAALWANRTRGRIQATQDGDTYQIARMTLSADRSTAAIIGTVGSVRVVDLSSGDVKMSAPYLARFAQTDINSSYAATLSPDGSRLATFALDSWSPQFDEARCGLSLDWENWQDPWFNAAGSLWDTETGCPIGPIGSATEGTRILPRGDYVWSPSGETLIATDWGNRSASVYDVTTGDVLFSFSAGAGLDPNQIEGWWEPVPAFTSDGASILAKTNPLEAALLDARTGAVQRRFRFPVPASSAEDPQAVIRSLDFVEEERRLLAVLRNGQSVYLDASSGQPVRGPQSLNFRREGRNGPNGEWINELKVYQSANDSSPIWSLPVDRFATSPDGQLLVTFEGASGAVRDPATGEQILALDGHTAPVREVLVLAGQNLALSGAEDGEVRLWDTALRQPVSTISGLRAPLLLSTGELLGLSADRRALETVDSSLSPVRSITLDGMAETVELSPNESRAAVLMQGGALRILSLASGEVLAEYPDVEQLAQSPFNAAADRVAFVARDGSVVSTALDMGAEQERATFEGPWRASALSADGLTLFLLRRDEVVAMNIVAGSEIWRFEGFAREDLQSGADKGPPPMRLDAVRLRLSPDGTRLLVIFEDSPRAEYSANRGVLLDTLTGEVVKRLPLGTYERLEDAVFSPSGTHLVTASSADIGRSPDLRTWDAVTGELVAFVDRVSRTRQSSWELDFVFDLSPSGERIITYSRSGEISVWATRSGRRIAEITRDLSPSGAFQDVLLGDGRAYLIRQNGNVVAIDTPDETRGPQLSHLACQHLGTANVDSFSLDELAEVDIPANRQLPCETLGLLSPRYIPDAVSDLVSRFN